MVTGSQHGSLDDWLVPRRAAFSDKEPPITAE
jgi:hypothetical protein